MGNPENTLFARLKAERDAAIELAEQAEMRCLDIQKEYEVNLENGYSEAYEAVTKERDRAQKLQNEKYALEKEIATLKIQNDRFLTAANIQKNYVDALELEFQKRELELHQEYDKKIQDQREFMVGKLDEFLRLKCEVVKEHLVLEECERLMAKGGEELLREVLGEDGVELQKLREERKAQEEAQAVNTAALRKAEARVLAEEAKQAKHQNAVDDHTRMRKMAKELLAKQISMVEKFPPAGAQIKKTKMVMQEALPLEKKVRAETLEDRVAELAEKKMKAEDGDIPSPPPARHYR